MDFLIPLLVGILSIFIIMKSAGYAITAISNYARQTGMSEYFIGFVVVSIATSFPELSTAIFASLAKQGGLFLGDVLGGSIIDLTVVFGLVAIFGRTIYVRDKTITKTVLPLGALVLLPVVLGFDGVLSRLDGIILILAFIIYMAILIRKEGKLGHVKKNVEFRNIWKDFLVFGGTLAALLLATRWFVLASISLAHSLNIPVFLMGLVFVSLGTTLPELTVNLKSILSKHQGIAFGDLLGSVIANLTMVTGIGAMIEPLVFDRFRFMVTGVILLFGIFLSVLFIKGRKITWKHGLVLVGLYIVFLLVQFVVR
jgi:cation:H+ antiporter